MSTKCFVYPSLSPHCYSYRKTHTKQLGKDRDQHGIYNVHQLPDKKAGIQKRTLFPQQLLAQAHSLNESTHSQCAVGGFHGKTATDFINTHHSLSVCSSRSFCAETTSIQSPILFFSYSFPKCGLCNLQLLIKKKGGFLMYVHTYVCSVHTGTHRKERHSAFTSLHSNQNSYYTS